MPHHHAHFISYSNIIETSMIATLTNLVTAVEVLRILKFQKKYCFEYFFMKYFLCIAISIYNFIHVGIVCIVGTRRKIGIATFWI